MSNNNQAFNVTYSAGQQNEVKKIQQKYLSKEEDKMQQLRKLDKRTTLKGSILSITIGIISALVLGFGMCCAMLWASTMFVPGIIIGIVGIIGVSITYPIFVGTTKKQREKLAPEIIKLSGELMQSN